MRCIYGNYEIITKSHDPEGELKQGQVTQKAKLKLAEPITYRSGMTSLFSSGEDLSNKVSALVCYFGSYYVLSLYPWLFGAAGLHPHNH